MGKLLRSFDYEMLRKGLAGEFAPAGAERQACHKLQLRGLMNSRQGIITKPYRGRSVQCCAWLYRTTDAGRAALKGAESVPIGDWSNPATATPLQDFKFVQQMGQKLEIAEAHRAKHRPHPN